MAKKIKKTKNLLFRLLGLVGSLICLAIFIDHPSFPTPDKLIVFLLFIFMIFEQSIEIIKRLGPFVTLILIYESFRGVVPKLNGHVNYTLAPSFDRHIFGGLPTKTLQAWLWHGHTNWYDIALYIPYLLFFIAPLGLAILVWKTKEKYYWQVVATYLIVFFAGFLTFLLYPAAPPWLASQNHIIEPITRVSSNVWATIGLKDFPSVYNHIAPNPVAAIPSLHVAGATLLSLFVFKFYGRRWGLISLIFPALLIIGVVYEGEHYVFDVVCGLIYAALGFIITPAILRAYSQLIKKRSKLRIPYP